MNETTPRTLFTSPALPSCLTLLLVSGCATPAPPSGDLAAAERAVVRAVKSGAAEWAPQELALAQQKVALTRRWLDAGDPTPAHWLAQQAQVDAELAAVKAKQGPLQRPRR